MLLRNVILLLCVSTALVSQGSAQNCPLITESELGSTTIHSNIGVVPTALRDPGDGPTISPLLLIYDFQITCSVAGTAPETYQRLSIVVAINCLSTSQHGFARCNSLFSPLGRDGNFTVQIDLTCTSSGWERGAGLGITSVIRENNLAIPANGSLDTVLDSQCSLCVNNRLRESALTPAAVYDDVNHCVSCPMDCQNVGLGLCTPDFACCSFYHDAGDGMGFQCVTSCPVNFTANTSFFCVPFSGVRCFTSATECSSSSSTDFFVADCLEACCLDSRGFFARANGPDDTNCDECIVFGLNGPSVIRLVEAETQDIPVGYIKGTPPPFYGLNVMATGGGGNASDSDFRVTPIGAFTVTTFQTGSVQVLAEVDTVALEPVETFFVTMEIIGNTIPANLFESRNTFLNDRIMVLIEDASVRCFTNATECSSSSSTDFFVADSLKACCLDSRGFFARANGPDDTNCDECIVFGLNGPSVIRLVEAETRAIPVGYIKGTPPPFYGFNLMATGGGGNASDSDFRVTPIGAFTVTTFQTGSVQVLAEVDTVALEPVETFFVTMEIIGNTIPANLFESRNTFLNDRIMVLIEDASDVLVNFIEADFGSIENAAIQVSFTVNAPIATDLDVRIRSMNLTQVFSLTEGEVARRLINLPDDFPDPGVYNPRRPYIASSVDQEIAKIDYNTSDIFIHIPATNATSTDIQVEIALVDDDIDEASLELFVMMLMTDDPRVNLTNGQFAARGNIRDNDGITIGFERVSYTFSEERLNPSVRDEVFIVKQNDQTSELTYDITIESFTGTATIRDFIAAGETDELFTPDLQRIAVNFQIIPDNLPEGIETFTFQLRNNDPATTFTNNPRETTISIFDTDDVIVGFNQTEFTVPENVGQVQLCLVMIVPTRDVTFPGSFPAGVETRDGTATGGEDFDVIDLSTSPPPIFLFSSTNREYCFDVAITNDNRLEANEMFTVLARENPPIYSDLASFVIQRDTVNITVDDNDGVLIEFDPVMYIVTEGGSGMFRIVKRGQSEIPVSVSLSTGQPSDTASAPDDYTSIISMTVMFSPGQSEAFVPFFTRNDSVIEDTERFSAVISNPSAGVTLGASTATVDIMETQSPSRVGFTEGQYQVRESAGRVVVQVELLEGELEATLNLFTVDGTARSPEDYKAVRVNVTLSASNRRESISISISDDEEVELNERFIMMIEVVNDPVEVALRMAEFIILNDDECPIRGVQAPPKILSSSDCLLSRCSRVCSYRFDSGDAFSPGALPLVSSDYHLFLCIHVCNLHLRNGRLCPNY